MVGNLRLIFVKRLILIVSLTFFGLNPVSGDITIRVANLKQDMELG